MTRRQLLHRAAALGVLSRMGTGCTAGASVDDAHPSELDPIDSITPNDSFYKVDYAWNNIPDAGWTADWTLSLTGLLSAEATLTLDQIKAFGGEDEEHTLECISSAPGYDAISNAVWNGITIADLLSALGITVEGTVKYIVITCGDGYVESLPWSDVVTGVRLVWLMNGVDLPIDHGAPLRALVPGRYGMKNPKWITGIDFAAEETEGTWEERGWSDDATVKLQSWFHAPDEDTLFGLAGGDIVGSAYAGAIPIAKVELSDDDGVTWQEAELTYNGPENVWTLWRFRWVPADTGTYTLQVRATDTEGNVQQDSEAYDMGLDGLDGIDKREFKVR